MEKPYEIGNLSLIPIEGTQMDHKEGGGWISGNKKIELTNDLSFNTIN